MRKITALICVLVLTSACAQDQRGLSTLAGPSATVLAPALLPSPQLSAQAPREINAGEEVNDALHFHGDAKFFELAAPSDGTLVARVSWDPQQGALELKLGDTPWSGKGVIVGKLPVVVGRKYSLSVADGAPWDYDDPFVLPFVLTTSIETETQPASGPYELVANNSQKCLDVNGWSTADGIPLHQWACHGGDNQLWNLEAAADGYGRIVSRHSGKCLDVNGASTDDGASVIQWECHGGANQQWRVAPVIGGYRILAHHSGKCLEVSGESSDDGASITQWQCHGGANQMWLLRSVTYGSARLSGK